MRGRIATVGLATVLAVSGLQASAAVFNDVATVSSAEITSATLQAPTSVTAEFTCGLVTVGSHVTVTWVEEPGATSYDVLRRTGTSGLFTTLGSTSSTTFTDNTAEFSTTYEYVVVATAGSWSSAHSTPPAQVTTPSACIA